MCISVIPPNLARYWNKPGFTCTDAMIVYRISKVGFAMNMYQTTAESSGLGICSLQIQNLVGPGCITDTQSLLRLINVIFRSIFTRIFTFI